MINEKTIKARQELEMQFVMATLSGVIYKTVNFRDIQTLCPLSMLQDRTAAKAMFHAMIELERTGKEISLPNLWIEIREKAASGDGRENWDLFKSVQDIGQWAGSVFGKNHEAITHLATRVRDEGLKRIAENEFIGLIADCQNFGNSLDNVVSGIKQLGNRLDSGVSTQESMADYVDAFIDRLYRDDFKPPLPSSWPNLNRVLKGGFAGGELVILAGRPGLGKTAFAGCLAVDIAKTGKNVLFITREVPKDTLFFRFIARERNIDLSLFRENRQSMPNLKESIAQGAATFRDLPLHLMEKTVAPMTPSEIRRLARSIPDISLVVVDYLQLVCPDEKQGTREREVAEMSRAFKQLALDCDCPVLLLSQLNRSIEQSSREPNLSDLRESGAIEQDADIVMFLHAEKDSAQKSTTPIKLIVAKGRSSGTGYAGMIFKKAFSNFVEDNDTERWTRKKDKNWNSEM